MSHIENNDVKSILEEQILCLMKAMFTLIVNELHIKPIDVL